MKIEFPWANLFSSRQPNTVDLASFFTFYFSLLNMCSGFYFSFPHYRVFSLLPRTATLRSYLFSLDDLMKSKEELAQGAESPDEESTSLRIQKGHSPLTLCMDKNQPLPVMIP